MRFTSESEAKRFVVQKVVAQAEREGVALSKAERHMLSWSEADPDFKPDLELASALDQEMSTEEYEAKVSRLIRLAYDREDKSARAQYRDAYSKLNEGDHYISWMIKRALGLKVFNWWPF